MENLKNEILSFYSVNTINPIGTPNVIVVGQEYEDKLISEIFIIYKGFDDKYSISYGDSEEPKIQGFIENLEDYMNNIILEKIKSEISLKASIEREKKPEKFLGDIKVNLIGTDFYYFFKKLKSEDTNLIERINSKTKSKKLKGYIAFNKAFSFTWTALD